MAEDSARAACHYRGEIPTGGRLGAERCDEYATVVEGMQRPGQNPPTDREFIHSQPQELSACDDAMLLPSKARYREATRGWQRIVADSATRLCHLARVAGGVLGVGDVRNGGATWA